MKGTFRQAMEKVSPYGNKVFDDYQNVFLDGSPELVIRYYKGKSGFDSPKWNTQKMGRSGI